jgi:hypothetical protein
MDERPVSIRLEVRFAEDVPEGVAFADGPPMPFAGWLGLMAAVEALAAQSKEDAHVDH